MNDIMGMTDRFRKLHLDFHNSPLLRDLGVEQIYGNDGSAAWCTVSNPLRFFSHRRDRVSGRMAACIWRIR